MYQNRHFYLGGKRLGRLHIMTGKSYNKRHMLFRIDIGPGAGCIGGFTLFFGINARPRLNYHFPKKVQAGITRNANAVPMLADHERDLDCRIVKHARNFGKHE